MQKQLTWWKQRLLENDFTSTYERQVQKGFVRQLSWLFCVSWIDGVLCCFTWAYTEKEPASLALLALAILSLRAQLLPVAIWGALCVLNVGEQDSSMILWCLAFHFAVGLYTLYVQCLRKSNVHSHGKFLVFSPMKCETSFFLASEEFSI